MVVDAETPRDRGDASAAGEHRAADASDDLVDRDHERVGKANVGEKTTEGSESFSPRPPDPASSSRYEPADRTTTLGSEARHHPERKLPVVSSQLTAPECRAAGSRDPRVKGSDSGDDGIKRSGALKEAAHGTIEPQTVARVAANTRR